MHLVHVSGLAKELEFEAVPTLPHRRITGRRAVSNSRVSVATAEVLSRVPTRRAVKASASLSLFSNQP